MREELVEKVAEAIYEGFYSSDEAVTLEFPPAVTLEFPQAVTLEFPLDIKEINKGGWYCIGCQSLTEDELQKAIELARERMK